MCDSCCVGIMCVQIYIKYEHTRTLYCVAVVAAKTLQMSTRHVGYFLYFQAGSDSVKLTHWSEKNVRPALKL